MNLYERIKKLCDNRGVAPTVVERELGFGRGYIGKLRNIKPSADRLNKIADYFGVPYAYLTDVDESEHHDGYYVDTETAELAQALFDDTHYRILFDAARGCRPEDLQMAADLLRRLKETNQ